jgi:hypothetical protein
MAVCDRVTLEGWRRRGLWDKSRELVASTLKEQV